MKPDNDKPILYPFPSLGIYHQIDVNRDGKVLRDGLDVLIVRVDERRIRVGCTTVSIEALERLLVLAKGTQVLQEGAN